MAVDLTSFKARFPEFSQDDATESGVTAQQDALITAALAEAEGRVDRSLFQNPVNADTAVKLLTAHLLACSPSGLQLKLAKSSGGKLQSSYGDLFTDVIRTVTIGYRVP